MGGAKTEYIAGPVLVALIENRIVIFFVVFCDILNQCWQYIPPSPHSVVNSQLQLPY